MKKSANLPFQLVKLDKLFLFFLWWSCQRVRFYAINGKFKVIWGRLYDKMIFTTIWQRHNTLHSLVLDKWSAFKCCSPSRSGCFDLYSTAKLSKSLPCCCCVGVSPSTASELPELAGRKSCVLALNTEITWCQWWGGRCTDRIQCLPASGQLDRSREMQKDFQTFLNDWKTKMWKFMKYLKS